MKRQRSSGAAGALWFFLLSGRQARFSGHRGCGAAGRGRAGRRGDRRAPAWRGPGSSGAAGAPGP